MLLLWWYAVRFSFLNYSTKANRTVSLFTEWLPVGLFFVCFVPGLNSQGVCLDFRANESKSFICTSCFCYCAQIIRFTLSIMYCIFISDWMFYDNIQKLLRKLCHQILFKFTLDCVLRMCFGLRYLRNENHITVIILDCINLLFCSRTKLRS